LTFRLGVIDVVVVGDAGDERAGGDLVGDGAVPAEEFHLVGFQRGHELREATFTPRDVHRRDVPAGSAEGGMADADLPLERGIEQIVEAMKLGDDFPELRPR